MSTVYASGAFDADNPTEISGMDTMGHVKRLVSTIELAVSDSGTVINFGKLSPNVRLLGMSVLRTDALTGLSDFDLGTEDDPDCLMDGVDITAGGSFSAISAVDLASLNKPLWNLQADTDDDDEVHGGTMDILGTLNAANTAAGTLTLELLYATY